jgi:hypothetical protein
MDEYEDGRIRNFGRKNVEAFDRRRSVGKRFGAPSRARVVSLIEAKRLVNWPIIGA